MKFDLKERKVGAKHIDMSTKTNVLRLIKFKFFCNYVFLSMWKYCPTYKLNYGTTYAYTCPCYNLIVVFKV